MVYPVLAYVAGPYRDARGHYYVEQNIRRAENAAVWLWQQGIPTLTPHLNTRAFDGAAPDEVWLQGDLEMLRRCDFMVLVEGWEKSSGTRAEVAFANNRKIPVFHFPDFEGAIQAWLDKKEMVKG